jgi:hypothetical protein
MNRVEQEFFCPRFLANGAGDPDGIFIHGTFSVPSAASWQSVLYRTLKLFAV